MTHTSPHQVLVLAPSTRSYCGLLLSISDSLLHSAAQPRPGNRQITNLNMHTLEHPSERNEGKTFISGGS
jgi:hypothetical protein